MVEMAKTKIKAAESSESKSDQPARERLILAAARLFAAKSFDGVSVREICKEAGTGINMIHHYFGNKDGLLEAIAERFDARVYAVPLRLLATPAVSADDLEARMALVFETTLEACIEARDILMVVLREQPELSTLVRYQATLVSFLETAKSDGLIRESVDTSMISGFLLDRVISQVQFMPWIKKTSGLDVAADADYRHRWSTANVDVFLRGVALA